MCEQLTDTPHKNRNKWLTSRPPEIANWFLMESKLHNAVQLEASGDSLQSAVSNVAQNPCQTTGNNFDKCIEQGEQSNMLGAVDLQPRSRQCMGLLWQGHSESTEKRR